MFAQANSEHCRHKIFNADWIVDGAPQTALAVRHDPQDARGATPQGTVVRLHGQRGRHGGAARASASSPTRRRTLRATTASPTHILMKVETHNHPTAISPFPGAATGSGGEIRDEGATGRGSKPKAGLCGFSVSNLRMPGRSAPVGRRPAAAPTASPRPRHHDRRARSARAVVQQRVRPPQPRRLLPHLRAGGGGRRCAATTSPSCSRAASATSGASHAQEGRASGRRAARPARRPGDAHRPGRRRRVVHGHGQQRGGPRLRLGPARQRRDGAPLPGGHRPLLRAGRRATRSSPSTTSAPAGCPTRCPSSSHGAGRGARFDLRAIPNEEPGMTPARDLVQRGAGALRAGHRARSHSTLFRAALRARALPVRRRRRGHRRPAAPVDRPALRQHARSTWTCRRLLGKPPRMTRDVTAREAGPAARSTPPASTSPRPPDRVLRSPTVADKTFLITIGDRTVDGPVLARPDGRPLAGAGRRLRRRRCSPSSGYTGEAMAMGERTPLAVIDAAGLGPHGRRRGPHQPRRGARRPASAASSSRPTGWRRPASPGEDAALFDTVQAVGLELCPALGVAIPVGKDSLSMRTVWRRGRRQPSGRRARCPSSSPPSRRATTCAATWTPHAAHRRRAHDAPARRPGAGKNAPRRLDPRAGLQPGGRRRARRRRSRGACAGFFAALAELRADGPRARLPRPLRRRPLRHPRRDGLRRPQRARRGPRRPGRRRHGRAGGALRRGAGRRPPGARRRDPDAECQSSRRHGLAARGVWDARRDGRSRARPRGRP